MATETKRDDTPSGELAAVEAQIAEVAAELAEVKEKITVVEAALRGGGAYLGITAGAELLTEKRALEGKEKQLREEKHDLRQKELRLMPMPQPAAPGEGEWKAKVEEIHQQIMNKADARTVQVSSVGDSAWDEMVTARKLMLQPYTGDLGAGVTVKDIQPFEWGPETEGNQATAYHAYLRNVIDLPDKYGWVDAACETNMLRWTGDELPFHVTGTTDCAICLAAAVNTMPSSGLCVLFELKKKSPTKQDQRQAMMQLLLANLHCPGLKPVVVLSDLGTSWRLFWLDDKVLRFQELDAGMCAGLVQKMVDEQMVGLDDQGLNEVSPPEGGHEVGPLHKRRKVEFGGMHQVARGRMQEHAFTGFEDIIPPDELRRDMLISWLRDMGDVPCIQASLPDAAKAMYS